MRLFVLLLGGWILGVLIPVPPAPGTIALAFLGLALGSSGGFRHRSLRFLLLLAACWALSAMWTHHRMPQEGPHDIAQLAPRRWAVVEGRIASDPLPTPSGWRFEVAVRALAAPWREAATGRLVARYRGREHPRFGQTVHLEGSLRRPSPAMNPGEFSYREYLARQGIYATLSVERIRVLEAAPWSLQGAAIALKDRCMGELSRHLPPDEASLLGSLLLGSGASPIDPETSDAFRALGLGHLLAVSGAQILIIVGVLKQLCLGLGLRRRLAIPLCMMAIAFYGMMTGLPPSVVRAIVMACLSLAVWGARRQSRQWVPLALAVWGMLIYHPAWLFDLGFQFSVIATFALQHTAPMLAERLKGVPEAMALAIASTLAAALWVTPLQLMAFGQLSAWTLVANLLAMLAIEALTVSGAGLLVLSLALSPLGLSICLTPYFKPLEWLLLGMTRGVAFLNELPGASFFLVPLAGWACAAMYGLLGVALNFLARGRDVRALVLLFVAASLPALRWPATGLELHVLSVGQGDGIVLRTPRGRWYLIDAGPAWDGGDAGERVILPFLRRQGVTHLSGIVLTHAHADHVGGGAGLVRAMPVAAVWDGGQASDDRRYAAFLAALLERHVPIRVVTAGLEVELERDLRLSVLGPPGVPWRGTHSDSNNNSVVLKLRYGKSSILLAGDLEQEAERSLARTQGEKLRADVLKVSHHGSRFGSVPEFLQAVRPRASVISVGERNTFRHPARDTLGRLEEYGPIYRTDRHGAVTMHSDGRQWRFRTVHAPEPGTRQDL